MTSVLSSRTITLIRTCHNKPLLSWAVNLGMRRKFVSQVPACAKEFMVRVGHNAEETPELQELLDEFQELIQGCQNRGVCA